MGDNEVMDQYYHPEEVRPIGPHWSNDRSFLETGSVSSLHKCQTTEATKLCIYDLPQKLRHSGEYDIGGTYSGSESDLWFYYSTSICPGYNYLLNLFVCHRKVGNFTIGISNSNELFHNEKPKQEISGWSVLPRTLMSYSFKSAQPNETFHIKTFCFTDKSLEALDANIMYIPINISLNCSHAINYEVINSIKINHDLSGLLIEKEKSDFVLLSSSGKKFPVHKIILIAHSPVLRNLLKDADNEAFLDMQDNDMELLLQFLYTGTIKDISKQDCMNLLKIADQLQLQNLFLLTQYALGDQINVDNAVDIAVLSQKYGLDKLQKKAFHFIKNNPKVMQTKSWGELNNVELMKLLIENIYSRWD